MKFRPVFSRCSATTAALLLACSLPSQAQNTEPPATETPAKPFTDAQKRARFLQQFKKTATQDPAGALTQGQEFLAANPTLKEEERIRVYDEMGQALYAADSKNADASLRLLEGAIAQYPQAEQRLALVRSKAEILLKEKRLGEAEALMQQFWPIALQGDRRWIHELFRFYLPLLKQQNKQAEISALVIGLIEARPTVLHWIKTENDRRWYSKEWRVPSYIGVLVGALLAQKRESEALSWAKLGFVLSEFYEGELSQATNLVGRVWLNQELSGATLQAFAKAQSDSTAPNPLADVALPSWNKAQLNKLLKDEQKKNGEQITLLLLRGQAGDVGAAMMKARHMILADPTGEKGQEGVRQAARLFKARDLNLVRANAFLDFYRKGTGENPMPAFLQAEAGGAATVATQ